MSTIIGLAYYQKNDWKRFLDIIDDRESIHDNWKEWHKSFLKMKKKLQAQGYTVNEVIVDLDELQNYCAVRGISNNGKARSQFVSEKQRK